MSWFTKTFSGSIGRKLIMALSGLFLITFLVVHLLGNLLLVRAEGLDFNNYAEFMSKNPVIKTMEYVLFAGFIFHIVYSIINSINNKKARPQGYAYNNPSENSSWFSRNMGLTGSIIFIFLVVHLNRFFIPHKVLHTSTNTMYDDAIAAFQSELYVGFYVIAMALLGFHLNHGFQSAFQTLGLRHPKYTPFIKGLGTAFSILIPAAFAWIPIFIYFFR